jgi:Flp pilus assembly protein TadD
LYRFEEAEAAILHALSLEPTSSRAWLSLGNLLDFHLGRREEAEAAYRRAIELDSAYDRPWRGLGHLLTVHFGRYEDAEAAYREAIRLNPNDSGHWNGLGNLLQDHLGRTEEGLQAYRRSLELNPDDESALANLAYLLHSTGSEEAEDCFAKALALLPPHGGALLKAYAALSSDNFGEATAALQASMGGGHPELLSYYFDDILRVLRLASKQGYGEKLLLWLDESGLGDRFWPLRAAFDAYLHGEARLGDVNPEVGHAARRIHQWLKGARPDLTPPDPRGKALS